MLCGDHAVVPGRRDATWVRGFGFNRAVDEGSSLEVEPGRLAGGRASPAPGRGNPR